MLSMSDIKLPEGVEIPALAQGPEADRPIVSIHIIKEIVIEEEEEVVEGAEAAEAAEAAEGAEEGEAAEPTEKAPGEESGGE